MSPLPPGSPTAAHTVMAAVELAPAMTERPAVPAHRATVVPELVPMVYGAPASAPQFTAPELAVVAPDFAAIVAEFALSPVGIGALSQSRQSHQGEQQDQAGNLPVTHGSDPLLVTLEGTPAIRGC